jgi:hypothetical protein
MAPMRQLPLIVGYLFVATLVLVPIAGFMGGLESWAGLGWSSLPLAGKAAVLWILLSAFGLWFWMLADFFAGRKLKHRVLIGFLLVFASWLAAAVYFVTVYARSPREA